MTNGTAFIKVFLYNNLCCMVQQQGLQRESKLYLTLRHVSARPRAEGTRWVAAGLRNIWSGRLKQQLSMQKHHRGYPAPPQINKTRISGGELQILVFSFKAPWGGPNAQPGLRTTDLREGTSLKAVDQPWKPGDSSTASTSLSGVLFSHLAWVLGSKTAVGIKDLRAVCP